MWSFATFAVVFLSAIAFSQTFTGSLIDQPAAPASVAPGSVAAKTQTLLSRRRPLHLYAEARDLQVSRVPRSACAHHYLPEISGRYPVID